jgi:hypothetical protein
VYACAGVSKREPARDPAPVWQRGLEVLLVKGVVSIVVIADKRGAGRIFTPELVALDAAGRVGGLLGAL